MSKPAQRWAARIVRLAVVAAVLVPAEACQDHDLLAPRPHPGLPKPNKNRSDEFPWGSTVDVNSAGETLFYYYGDGNQKSAISTPGGTVVLPTTDNSIVTASNPAAINNLGQVVGNEISDTYYGFVWTPDQPNGTTGKIERLSTAVFDI